MVTQCFKDTIYSFYLKGAVEYICMNITFSNSTELLHRFHNYKSTINLALLQHIKNAPN